MGLDKRTIKIIAIVVAVLLVIGIIVGILLAVFLPYRYVELQVFPRSEEYNYYEPLIRFRASDPGSWHTTRPQCRMTRLARPAPPTGTTSGCRCPAVNEHSTCGLRIHYWVPEPYNVTRPQQRPAHHYGDYVWVSCHGEFNTDEENIGPIQYIPANVPPGFPTSRLHTADRIPYATRNLPDQVPGPLVGVFFENPRRGVVINVECRIWTRDIVYNPSNRVGRTRFELYVE
ncbi:unnamed protein product [Leptidea sinapis]|uniref:Sodium/potassium-transporting ATPase subunit beta-2 n=1 Tax=Leptidea sinapis TaxID=189913 RepID=A0A5E4R5E8_9NEOP|nr:unnamed protein product [Leptidea sinapis]